MKVVRGQNSFRCPIVGVSLMELLAVIAIMGLLLALAAPALKGVSGANKLTAAGSAIVSEINLARQEALSKSRQVDVRFYCLPDDRGGAAQFRAMQCVIDGRPVRAMEQLPSGISIVDDVKFSTLVSPQNPLGGTADLPPHEDVPFKAIRFNPDGSTALDPLGSDGGNDRWFLTIRNGVSNSSESTKPALNFITVQVDPVSGRTRVFQP